MGAIATGLICSPQVLIWDYCQAGGRVSGSVLKTLLWTLPFNIALCKLAEDTEDTLIRHAADTELSGTADATDDRLKIHTHDPAQAGVGVGEE